MIGGITDYDADQGALGAIMAEWSRLDLAIDARIANLNVGVGANSAVAIAFGKTVKDDVPARDLLFGGCGADWLLTFDHDWILDRSPWDRAITPVPPWKLRGLWYYSTSPLDF